MNRVCLILIFAVAIVAGCGSSTSSAGAPTGGDGGSGDGGGGKVTATVTFKLNTYNLSGGKCTDVGAVLGTEVSVGDYHDGVAGPGDYLELFVKANSVSVAQGRAGGIPWTLATGRQSGSIDADMKGTFSGMDTISGSQVSGTFACN
jgi:hypothetical protein